jgi:TRAP-type C4-dicarboxylate transport system permease small subunit
VSSKASGEAREPPPSGAAERWVGRLARVFAWAATLAVLYSVVMRYVVGQPQTWSDELIGFLTVATVMLGAAEASRRGDHVEVDLLTARAGPRMRRIAALWACVAVLGVAGVLLAGGWEMVAFSRMTGLLSEGYLEAPLWIPQLAVPVGMAALIAVTVVRTIRLLRGPTDPADRD